MATFHDPGIEAGYLPLRLVVHVARGSGDEYEETFALSIGQGIVKRKAIMMVHIVMRQVKYTCMSQV